MVKSKNMQYVRKEWMHPEDMDMKNPANHVLYLKHLKAYEYVLPMVKGKRVLEIGCGSGYGNRMLAEDADEIVSVDIDKESLEFAQKHNSSQNVKYIEADVTKGIPLDQNSFDLCVCFQVIEHIKPGDDMFSFLNEIIRLVKPGGDIFFTTPNRKIRLYPFQKPTNKYHETEYTARTLQLLLSRYFSDVNIFGMQAMEKLKKIEINRSKRSLYNFLIVRPIKKLLKLFGISGPLLPKNKQKSARGNMSDRTDFNTTNFWLDPEVPDDSIDLLAHCTKY